MSFGSAASSASASRASSLGSGNSASSLGLDGLVEQLAHLFQRAVELTGLAGPALPFADLPQQVVEAAPAGQPAAHQLLQRLRRVSARRGRASPISSIALAHVVRRGQRVVAAAPLAVPGASHRAHRDP